MSQLKNNTTNELIELLLANSLRKEEPSSFLFYFKLFSFLIITVITFGFGLLPLYFSKFRQGHIILNYANPFSGGIFIGIGLFHLLPDASYNFEQYYRTPEGSSSFFYGFPMSYFIAFLSYSFILYLEKVAFSTEEADLKDNNLLLDNDIKMPLIDGNNDNKENIDINDEKIISSIIYKRNKGNSI